MYFVHLYGQLTNDATFCQNIYEFVLLFRLIRLVLCSVTYVDDSEIETFYASHWHAATYQSTTSFIPNATMIFKNKKCICNVILIIKKTDNISSMKCMKVQIRIRILQIFKAIFISLMRHNLFCFSLTVSYIHFYLKTHKKKSK